MLYQVYCENGSLYALLIHIEYARIFFNQKKSVLTKMGNKKNLQKRNKRKANNWRNIIKMRYGVHQMFRVHLFLELIWWSLLLGKTSKMMSKNYILLMTTWTLEPTLTIAKRVLKYVCFSCRKMCLCPQSFLFFDKQYECLSKHIFLLDLVIGLWQILPKSSETGFKK